MGLFSLLGEAYHRLVWGRRKKKPYEHRIEILMFDKKKLKKVKTVIRERVVMSSGGWADLILRPNLESMVEIKRRGQGLKPLKFYDIGAPVFEDKISFEEKVESIKDKFIEEYKEEEEKSDGEIYE